MAEIISLPFSQDARIYKSADFDQINFKFWEDDDETTATDFTGATFTGEVLDKPGGTKLFDFTFNTPSDDGQILPTLTKAQTATLTDRKCWYWVQVDDAAYYSGWLTVDGSFVAGS